jgi:hypothetical protein
MSQRKSKPKIVPTPPTEPFPPILETPKTMSARLMGGGPSDGDTIAVAVPPPWYLYFPRLAQAFPLKCPHVAYYFIGEDARGAMYWYHGATK